MKNTNMDGILGFGEISIEEFNRAYSTFDKLGHLLMEAWSKWDGYYSIVEEYRLNGVESFQYNTRLYQAIVENGIGYFEHREEKTAEKMFSYLNALDRKYADTSGRHFKGFVKKEDKTAFLADFTHAFDIYMSGGHQDTLVAVA